MTGHPERLGDLLPGVVADLAAYHGRIPNLPDQRSTDMPDINTPVLRESISDLMHDMLGDVVPEDRLVEVTAHIFVLMDRASALADAQFHTEVDVELVREP